MVFGSKPIFRAGLDLHLSQPSDDVSVRLVQTNDRHNELAKVGNAQPFSVLDPHSQFWRR